MGDNNSDQSALTAVVIYIKTYFNIRGNSFGYFSQLSIYDIREKKIKKSVHRERRTLPNKLFIVGYDAREFVTSSKMAAILTATILEPISRQKNRFYFGSNRLGI